MATKKLTIEQRIKKLQEMQARQKELTDTRKAIADAREKLKKLRSR